MPPGVNIRKVLPKDAIPSIDDPQFDADHFGDDDDEVAVVEGSIPKAYPLRILDYHEIVNDEIDGRPIAVTWCPLCGSAVVYDRTVDDQVLSFGVSGKLADDDLVMYDRETGSEWKQSLGECIAGAFEGRSLTMLPAAIVSYGVFKETHPEGVVLQPTGTVSEAASDDDDPAPIEYDRRPYERYFEAEGFGLSAHRGEPDQRTWSRDDLDPKEVVLGIENGGEAIGYPRSQVEAAGGVVVDTIGDTEVIVVAIEEGIHAFEHPGGDVTLEGDRLIVDGRSFHPATGRGMHGATLARIPAIQLFAFTWLDDHGEDALFFA